MYDIPYITKSKLGLPMTPAKWVGEPTYKPVTRLRITCGGGIGGSSWYEYVERENVFPSNKLHCFTRIDGKKITINTAFIVEAEDFRLVTVAFWNENPSYKLGLQNKQYIVEDECKIELIDEFDFPF